MVMRQDGEGLQSEYTPTGVSVDLGSRGSGTRSPRRRRPLFVVVAALVVAFAAVCTILALATGSAPQTRQATAQPTPTATATATPLQLDTHVPKARAPIYDGPSYIGKPLPKPAFTSASPAQRGCRNGAPKAPFWPVNGITGNNYATAHKEIALTFDDGPSDANSDTPQLLSWLVAHHVPATFMVVGVRIANDPGALQQEYADGFDIGVHTWDHADMTKLTPAAMRQELGTTLALIHQVLGPTACVWFWRPPYGAYNGSVMSAAQSFGLTSVMWDMDPRDWSSPATSAIVGRVEGAAHPGAILLEHDGPGNRWETLAAVKQYVPYLEQHGYHFVTISKLLADSHLPPSGPPPTPVPTIAPRGMSATTNATSTNPGSISSSENSA